MTKPVRDRVPEGRRILLFYLTQWQKQGIMEKMTGVVSLFFVRHRRRCFGLQKIFRPGKERDACRCGGIPSKKIRAPAPVFVDPRGVGWHVCPSLQRSHLLLFLMEASN